MWILQDCLAGKPYFKMILFSKQVLLISHFPSYSAQVNCTDFLLVFKEVKFAFPVEGMFFLWFFIFQDGSSWLIFLFIFNITHHLSKQVSLPNQTLALFYEIIYPYLAFKGHPKYFIEVDTHVSGRMKTLPRKITIKNIKNRCVGGYPGYLWPSYYSQSSKTSTLWQNFVVNHFNPCYSPPLLTLSSPFLSFEMESVFSSYKGGTHE